MAFYQLSVFLDLYPTEIVSHSKMVIFRCSKLLAAAVFGGKHNGIISFKIQ